MGSTGATDDEIIRRKLLIDGEGMGDDRRLDLLLKSFLKWVDHEGTDETQTTLGALENAVDGCLNSMVKSQKMLAMNQIELNQYNDLYAQIGEDIKQTSETISRTRSELQKAKEIRSNKEQYHALAKVIAGEKDRSGTEKNLSKAEKGMVDLKKKRDSLAARIEQHHRQFQVLLSSVQQLSNLGGKDGELLEEGEMDANIDDLTDDDDDDDDTMLSN